jgi:ionotropic glutamate receptor
VADLTITYERADVVDFTREFMQTGISLLYLKPTRSTPELFSFLSPLSNEVWFYMLAIYAVVSVMLFLLARFTPYEWVRPHPCQHGESNLRENQFTFLNSFWFTMASLMQQGKPDTS